MELTFLIWTGLSCHAIIFGSLPHCIWRILIPKSLPLGMCSDMIKWAHCMALIGGNVFSFITQQFWWFPSMCHLGTGQCSASTGPFTVIVPYWLWIFYNAWLNPGHKISHLPVAEFLLLFVLPAAKDCLCLLINLFLYLCLFTHQHGFLYPSPCFLPFLLC